jgi:REP element-mobilizing transposase RayT
VKRKLHQFLRTDEGVLHRIVYGLAWATHRRALLLSKSSVERLVKVFEKEAAEHGWRILDTRIEADHIVLVVEVWPNHSAHRAVTRLQSAAGSIKSSRAGESASKALWAKGYVATTDLESLDELVAEFLNTLDKPA